MAVSSSAAARGTRAFKRAFPTISNVTNLVVLAETIDGSATYVISNDGGSVELTFEGTEWSVATNYLARDTDTKHNLSASVPPLVTDDAAAGYKVGSLWVDTGTGIGYLCLDATGGAAAWQDITSMAGHAPSTELYLTNGVAAGLSAEVNVQALIAALSFIAGADIVPVIVKGSAGHTVALFQVQDSTAAVQIQVLANGKLDIDFGALIVGDLNFDGVAQQLITKSGAGDLVVGTEAGGTDLVFRSLGTDCWRLLGTGELASVGADRQIQGVADPTAAQHAATKAYVDGLVGLVVQEIVATPYAVLVTDDVVLCNLAAPGPVAITLPVGATHLGAHLVVKDKRGDAGVNNITVTPNGAETIDGAPFHVIGINLDSRTFVWKGTEWSVI